MAAVLRSVAASGELAVETRTDAAVALGRSSDLDSAIDILRSLSDDHIPPAARVRIAEAIIALNSDATDAAEAVLRTMSTGTGSLGPAVRAAELLAEFGQQQQAVDLAWSVIDDNDGAYPAQTISAVRIILRYQGADGAAGLLHVAGSQLRMGRPMLWWILIELTRWGFSDRVIEFCRQALADPGTIEWQWSSVAGGWAFAAGPSAITEIFRVLDERGTPYEEAAGKFPCGYWKRGTRMISPSSSARSIVLLNAPLPPRAAQVPRPLIGVGPWHPSARCAGCCPAIRSTRSDAPPHHRPQIPDRSLMVLTCTCGVP